MPSRDTVGWAGLGRTIQSASPDGRPRHIVNMKIALLAAVLVGSCVGLAGCTPSTPLEKPGTFEAFGNVTVPADIAATRTEFPRGHGCVSVSAYSDIVAGSPIEVGDPDGPTVATGSLKKPTLGRVYSNRVCVFGFSVNDVPLIGRVTVHVGDSNRGNPIHRRSLRPINQLCRRAERLRLR
jgi:hypothetical protein